MYIVSYVVNIVPNIVYILLIVKASCVHRVIRGRVLLLLCMKSIKSNIFLWLEMSRHIKTVTLNGIVCIHRVYRIEYPVRHMEHPVHRRTP